MKKRYFIVLLILSVFSTFSFSVLAQTKQKVQGVTPSLRPIDLSPPTVVSLKINNGAATTTSRTVTLNNVTERATLFCASERPDLQGAYWKNMHSAPQFILSSGNGNKTVYFQVADSKGRKSEVVSDMITLIPPIPVITLFTIGNYGLPKRPEDRNCPEGYCWEIRTENRATNSPTHYRFSEKPDFSDSNWKAYKTKPTFFAKRRGIGQRFIYFQLKNQHGVSERWSRSFHVRNRKDFRMSGNEARRWAEQRGFTFSVVGNHPLAQCELEGCYMSIPYNALYGSKCSYSLFYGKYLHGGWIFKSDFIYYGSGSINVVKKPTLGSRDISYGIDLEYQRAAAGPASCAIQILTLEGPGDGLPWEAF